MSKSKGPSVPKDMLPWYEAITKLTDAVCREHLTEEYASLARDMAAALCRKRPSPLLQGYVNSWASGILVALGRINWLFDRSQDLHFTIAEISGFFGISQSTGSAKATQIQKALKIKPVDPKWTLQSRLDDHPLAWLIELNGFLVDARMLPKEIQEKASQAGLIPYVPSKADDDE